jgi:aspartate racemase
MARDGRCLGLIGGLGPAATVHYYRALVAAHDAQGRVLRLLMAHADLKRAVALVTDNDLDGLARYLASLVAELEAGGAEVTAIVAVTPHICAPQLAPLSRLPLIDMVSEVADAVRRRGLRRVALLGTRFTVETQMFGGLRGIDVVRPAPEEVDRIHDCYLAAVAETFSDRHRAELYGLAETFMRRDGAEAILIAGTDLSPLLDAGKLAFPAVDCAGVHIEAIVRRLLG